MMFWAFAILALTASASAAFGDDASDCFDDYQDCLPAFRQRFLDTKHFFYGDDYSLLCPGAKFCVPQPEPPMKSPMSRLKYTNDTATLQNAVKDLQILNVTFHRPAQKYFACDEEFKVPEEAPLTIPPLGLTKIPIIHVHSEPEITWTPRTPTSKYMVILYDAPGFVLHSIYINCVGGSLKGCTNVRPYFGPGVVFLMRTSYVFMVLEQYMDLSVAVTKQAAGPGIVRRVDQFLSQLPAYVDPTIKFGVIMELYPDPYSSHFIKHVMNRNTCPLFYSQMYPFQAAMRSMQIPSPKWAPDSFSLSQISTSPQLSTLSVVVDVTYNSKPLSVENVCCQDYTAQEGKYKITPFNTKALQAAQVRDRPFVDLSPIYGEGDFGRVSGRTYTLLMVDATPAVNPVTTTQTEPKLYIHWALTNIRWARLNYGIEVQDYFGPLPRGDYDPNLYMFLLFEQTETTDPEAIRTFCPNRTQICQSKITDIISTWNLGDIVGINYFAAEGDLYSVKKYNDQFNVPYSTLCAGKQGYADPCPPRFNGVNGLSGFNGANGLSFSVGKPSSDGTGAASNLLNIIVNMNK